MRGSIQVNVPLLDPSTANTVYGPGHRLVDFNDSKVEVWRAEGKVSLLGPVPRSILVVTTTTTATISCTVEGCSGAGSGVQLQYGLTTGLGTNLSMTQSGDSFTATPTGLTTNTLYFWQIVATMPIGATYTPQYTFRTL